MGTWEEPRDECVPDADNDSIADMNDLCVNSETTSFASDLSNDADRDGCEDAVEDVDDDGTD